MRGNVVDLAVAVVIGAAFGAVVTALVADLITPLVAAIFGKPSFAGLSFEINKSTFLYGDFLNAVLVVPGRRGGDLLPRRQAPERARGPAGGRRAAGCADHARLPRVPERDPDRRPPLRVLHVCRPGDGDDLKTPSGSRKHLVRHGGSVISVK